MDHPATSPISQIPAEASPEFSEITIPQANAILLAEALTIARNNDVPLGKSTLQRWAKKWAETPSSPVKALIQVTRDGRHYELDRDDFEAWLLQEAENRRTLRNPTRPDEASQDLERPQETRQDPERSHEASHETPEIADRVKELEAENMDLKIDLGVRKQLLDRAKDEIDGIRSMTDSLLRENGSLQYQLQQLPPARENGSNREVLPPVDNRDQADGPAV
jgi:hypothetical protein